MIQTYAVIKQSGPPTKDTPGAVGQIYVDTSTGLRWECVEARRERHYKSNRVFYDWEERGLDPEFVVSGLTDDKDTVSLPVKLDFYEIICTRESGSIDLPNSITLNEGDTYLLYYQYLVGGVEDPANSITALSTVTNGVVYWGSSSPDNSVMLTTDKVTDTWCVPDDTHRSVYTIYRVEKVIETGNENKYHLMTLEGHDSIASGIYAHAEGCTTVASGMYSHAEGTNTVASGDHSHAEGFNTEAAGAKQHVEGMYNEVDDEGKYAHIVGNGPDDSSRSNAHTLDWEGNGWFAGDVYVGGQDQSTGKVLGTKPMGMNVRLYLVNWQGSDNSFGQRVNASAFMGDDAAVTFTVTPIGDDALEYFPNKIKFSWDFVNKQFIFSAETKPTKDITFLITKQEIALDRGMWYGGSDACLIFASSNPFSITAPKNWDGTLEYSTDINNWITWGGNTINAVKINDGYLLALSGTGNTKISSMKAWTITGSDVACLGNIETLLDWKTVVMHGHPTMATGCFMSMFNGCTALILPPNLPATTLADLCYYGMFSGCTSLTQTPNLPATTLATGCYAFMFNGCTSLTGIPELPATTLASDCYQNMFYGCTALTTAPSLPATTLADRCYTYMFGGCTALTTAPSLSATTLADRCYTYMFGGCTALTTAPSLSATTLATRCYWNMFNGCTALVIIPSLTATALTKLCYSGMFSGCASIKLSETQTDEYTRTYRIPNVAESTGTTTSDSLTDMFKNTGGTFTGEPTINTTYYLHKDCTIV